MISSQASSSPIGKLPMSPMNSRATGRLKGAKPSIAPLSARATMSASGGSAPRAPINATPTVIGTTSATIIQSIPSMKLTRLTNHRAADEQQAALEPERKHGQRAQVIGHGHQHEGDGGALHAELCRGVQIVEIVGGAEQHQKQCR